MEDGRRPTIRDIAREAGVSVATVSRVTHDDARVVAATRRRVQDAIDRLGYSPSALGRGLATRRTNTLGIVLPGLGGPYFAELVQGAESVAVERGTAINVLGTHLRPDADGAVRDLAARTDGLIVAGGTVGEDLLVRLSAGTRVVLVAGRSDVVPTVRTDGRAAAIALTKHLVAPRERGGHGYRRLRFLGEPSGSPDTHLRYSGFRQALGDAGLAECGEPLRYGLEVGSGALAARRLHEQHRDGDRLPEALVCANDELAFGMLITLPGLGYRLPDDVAITGFDDQDLAALASPTLTTVHQPVHDLGARAAALALDGTGGRGPVGPPGTDVVLPTELVVRESCGCSAA
ncbi:LacI family DNA-binding transcriptional regulator [Kineococcus gynurae]|uniref:LacI family DNA-binding transcriptional regulator n=1 Tax=Kineococcus gynurae TaxID=452979 RepID=A0ABV5LXM5_9ACTN